ncbi:MAG: hypothetical protein DIU73_004525 [Actinomycetes bacterium]|nr:MAG: hypothetical protein DIU73_02700 [Actinomycetota bacterium]
MNSQYYEIGPGFGAFVVTFALALTIWLLYRSFSKKLRRQRLEERRLEELAAQQAAEQKKGGKGSKGGKPSAS